MDCSPPGSSRQEYWRGLPFPPPGDLPNPRIKPASDFPCISWICRQILYHWATWEAFFHTCIASLNISISYQVVNLLTINESTLTYHHRPKSRIYIKVDFWWYTFYRFGQVDNDVYPSLPDTEYFQCFKSLLHSTYLSTPFPTPGIHLSFFFPVSMVLPVLGNVKVGVMYMSSFPIGILHVVINIQVLCGLRAYFSLVLNNTPLSRYTRVHLSIHLLKDILMASIFRHMNKTAINIHVQVLVWT